MSSQNKQNIGLIVAAEILYRLSRRFLQKLVDIIFVQTCSDGCLFDETGSAHRGAKLIERPFMKVVVKHEMIDANRNSVYSEVAEGIYVVDQLHVALRVKQCALDDRVHSLLYEFAMFCEEIDVDG
jgi:hypothetical protein